MLLKCSIQYVSKFVKLSSGYRNGRGRLHSNPKEVDAKECSNYHTIVAISYDSEDMFKVLQARLQQYVNQEHSGVQVRFRKNRGTINIISNICCIIKKAREFQESIYICFIDFSVQFSHTVGSDILWPHGLQHSRSPCPSSTPGVYSNSCPLNQWCHPTISSSVIPFSSCLQSFPVSGSFPVSQFCPSGGQSIGVSASTSVLPVNIQDWSPLGWTCWISLQSKALSRIFSNTTVQKHQFFGSQLSLCSSSHIYTSLTMLKPFTVWITTNCGSFLKRRDY